MLITEVNRAGAECETVPRQLPRRKQKVLLRVRSEEWARLVLIPLPRNKRPDGDEDQPCPSAGSIRIVLVGRMIIRVPKREFRVWGPCYRRGRVPIAMQRDQGPEPHSKRDSYVGFQ
jgi:hypothetical protein